MAYILSVLLGYLLGCSNMALYICKLKKVDLRQHGSANLGASNAAIVIGWRAGVLTAVHDIAKAILAVVFARLLFPQAAYIGAVAGVACVLGHIFPFYLKFRGGKGFASYIGLLLALDWKFALVMMALVLVITLIFDYITIGTFSTIVAGPVYLGIAQQDFLLPLILLIASAVILYKHWENIPRILNGTEKGLRSVLKKQDRV